MRLICLSDTHGLHHRVQVPDGDVLVHAGDFTEYGERYEVDRFLGWLEALPHAHKVFIAGNHDFYTEKHAERFAERVRAIPRVTYLCDSGTEIEGVKFWGSPVQPWFFEWAFNRHRGQEIQEHWDMIPDDTEVLVTHGPPQGVLDLNSRRERHGCANLRRTIERRLKKLRLHVFGHIHPGGGQRLELKGTIFVNAAICNEGGYAVNPAVTVDL